MALFTRKAKPGAQPAPTNRTPPASPSTTHAGDAAEDRIHALGMDMLDRARNHKAGLLSAKFYQDKLMDWAMQDHEFKVQLFRFVDAYPAFTTPEMVHDHLMDYLTQPGVKLPPFMSTALKAGGVAKGLMTKTVSSQIKNMAGNFIAGTDAADALPRLRKLWKDGIAFSVDLLGEACVSDAEADEYQKKYLDLVENLTGEATGWNNQLRLEQDHLGVVPRVNVSIKVSSLCAQFDPIEPERAIEDLLERLGPILEAAKRNAVLINFDMEQFELKDLTLEAFFRACEAHDFEAGLAMQAYLKSGVDDARRVADWAKRTGRVVTVRLVKGAYWDYETIHAEQEGWPCPVWNAKWQTDKCFEQMAEVLLDACPRSRGEGGTKLALGSHNVRSIAAALAGLEARGLPRDAIELQMLHGMADQLKHAAEGMGLRVREYIPVGEMIPGMAYLVRRLLENTSNESWLKAGFMDDASPAELLASPESKSSPVPDGGCAGAASGGGSEEDLYKHAPERHNLSPATPGVGDSRPFYSEPLRDFAEAPARAKFAAAIKATSVPQVANDRTPEQGVAMVEAAHNAFANWRDFDPIKRAEVLVRTAAKMRTRRDELAAVMIKESSKPWREADADVCEAIDFCEYYARLAPPMFERRRLGRFIGELDELWYQPRGVAVVISPWNFPLAICCGMVSAALITGNTVICKPAEQSPAIAKLLCEMIWQALKEVGAPGGGKGILQFCPAPGETTGAALVRDPRVAMLAFTGSKAVGLDIIQAAAMTQSSPVPDGGGAGAAGGGGSDHSSIYPASAFPQPHVKRVVCEMGGKNALIIDSSADLDEAVLGARYSAFGFAGQKCSACSRCIVVDPEGPRGPGISLFTQRLAEATKSLIIGDPAHPGTDVAPVIDEESADKIRSFIQTAKGEQLTELVGEKDFENFEQLRAKLPALVPPTIFAGVNPTHTIYQQEIFGPVLAIIHAISFDEALQMANDHQYKLTGGVFTRKPSHIEKAKREFRVGNLYINRAITGALVGRQPFGGFGMSGVGSKAGGPDYLMQFVEPRACAENTMRRGFAPEL